MVNQYYVVCSLVKLLGFHLMILSVQWYWVLSWSLAKARFSIAHSGSIWDFFLSFLICNMIVDFSLEKKKQRVIIYMKHQSQWRSKSKAISSESGMAKSNVRGCLKKDTGLTLGWLFFGSRIFFEKIEFLNIFGYCLRIISRSSKKFFKWIYQNFKKNLMKIRKIHRKVSNFWMKIENSLGVQKDTKHFEDTLKILGCLKRHRHRVFATPV